VTLVAGTSFCLSARDGDLEPGALHGLFHRDTRFLSGWQLRINGSRPEVLSTISPGPFSARFVCRLPPPVGLADSTLLVIRTRSVGEGMWEEVALHNLAGSPASLELVMLVEADFAGLFQVKDGHPRQARPAELVTTPDGVELLSSGAGLVRGTSLRVPPRTQVAPAALTLRLDVPARSERSVSFTVSFLMDGVRTPGAPPGGPKAASEAASAAAELDQWRRRVTPIRSPEPVFNAALSQGVEDLGALRILDPDGSGAAVVAAGAPWFMALFGRDSLITAWMSLILDESMAGDVLTVLSRYQGRRDNPATEEQPGRILHEMRWGLTHLGGGENVYYGTVDAPALFVMLWGELARRGHRPELVDQLLPNADRALAWMTGRAAASRHGFVSYQRTSPTGLVNQGWKDSWDGINFADGRIAEAPIALCEVQGYVYAAYQARAAVALQKGDQKTHDTYVERAQNLKVAFNRSFWLDDLGYFAVGLDQDARPIDSLASNLGHCLWTGIIDEARAPAVVARLMSPQMFTGWGLRTLSSEMAAYNPVSYHNGSVWPHDTALAVAGLVRYGFRDQAAQLAHGLVEASSFFGGRLPELFCGFSRTEFPVPIAYPTSCSPQAWAAAVPFSLATSLKGIDSRFGLS
jgi:glycogen debranching enzyme